MLVDAPSSTAIQTSASPPRQPQPRAPRSFNPMKPHETQSIAFKGFQFGRWRTPGLLVPLFLLITFGITSGNADPIGAGAPKNLYYADSCDAALVGQDVLLRWGTSCPNPSYDWFAHTVFHNTARAILTFPANGILRVVATQPGWLVVQWRTGNRCGEGTFVITFWDNPRMVDSLGRCGDADPRKRIRTHTPAAVMGVRG